MGAGLRKWRGSQISEGQGREEEGKEGWACCQPGPRLSTDPGRRRRGPPSKLSSVQTFRSLLPGLSRGGPGGSGEYRPATQRREGGRQPWTPRTVATTPSGQPRAKQRRPWRAAEWVPPPAKFPERRLAEAKAPGMPALLPHPPRAVAPGSERAQELTRVPQRSWQRCLQGQAYAGNTDSEERTPGGGQRCLPAGLAHVGYLQTRPGVLIVCSASLSLVSHVPRVPTAGSPCEYSCYVGLMCGKGQEMSGMSVSCGHPLSCINR